MSNLLLSGSLLLFNLLSMIALMMSSKRHIAKFQTKRPLLLPTQSNPTSNYHHKWDMTAQQRLRRLGLLLLLLSLGLTCFSHRTGYFIVVWFASLILAAGSVYLSMVIHEKMI